MTMVTMPSEKNEAGQVVRFVTGVALFAAYAMSLFASHPFSVFWLWTYLIFLVPILLWSGAHKKMGVLIGFLSGTILAVVAVVALILYVLTHWGGC